ncbi:lipopolysaccharide assembly protein LapA domain-containing protein [Nocardia sp. NPDC050710]|uniref:LapA family protein n=1 Tax=Nocardia sp. NPDC050710 TaxID=3157220 RepID=UPI003404E0C3
MSAKYQPVTASNAAGGHFLRREHRDPETQPRPRGSRARAWTARAWIEIAVGAIIAIMLLIFILQNTAKTKISFLAWSFTMPLGVALLFATIGGVLVMALAGGARIWQLRHQRAETTNR